MESIKIKHGTFKGEKGFAMDYQMIHVRKGDDVSDIVYDENAIVQKIISPKEFPKVAFEDNEFNRVDASTFQGGMVVKGDERGVDTW